MELYLAAEEFDQLVVGLHYKNKYVFKSFQAGPDLFLKSIRSFFNSRKITWADISKIVVVTGPGPFSALRAILTVVNTVSVEMNIPLVGIDNQLKMDDQMSFEQGVKSKKVSQILSPHYHREPNIILNKQHRLLRK